MKCSSLTHGLRAVAFCGLLLVGGVANAASCTGVSVGTSSTHDVTLGGMDASQCVVSTVNAQGGAQGDTSAFSSAFGNGWSLLGKVDSNGTVGTLNSLAGVTFDLGFTNGSGTSGTWSLAASKNVTLDLVFAMHAGGRTDSFLFDDISFIPNAQRPGTWTIDWVNKGGQVPGYSNLTLFARDVTSVAAVPEPETYALMFAGLGMVGAVVRRRRTQ